MKFKAENEEVFYAEEPIVQVTAADIVALERKADVAARRRSRLCAHPNPQDSLHEMLIVHERGAYVRPHRHLGRSESFHVIQGDADVVIFTESGEVQQVIRMGEFDSSRAFFYRQPAKTFHTVLIRSSRFVFHETTSGPFRPDSTEFAKWAPEDNSPEVSAYVSSLEKTVAELLRRPKN